MASEVLDALLRANVAGACAALLLLALRGRLRPLIGPGAVYGLWLMVPAAALASLVPARTLTVVMTAPQVAAAPASVTAAPNMTMALLALWLGGAAVAALAVAWRQWRFLARFGLKPGARRVFRAASRNAGPAVVGVLAPRILLPADFAARFNATQRRMVLAHEAVHLTRGDSRTNAAVLLLQCLAWFNPIAHLAARAMRLDQELSCDARVIARFPKARRSYAEAMLKSQGHTAALPLGCYWPARGPSALSRRLAMLRTAPLSRARLTGGLALAGLAALTTAAAAWSLQPPRQQIVWRVEQVMAETVPPVSLAVTPPARTTSRSMRVRRDASAQVQVAQKQAAPEPAPPRHVVQWMGWNTMPMVMDGEEAPKLADAGFTGAVGPTGRMTSQTSADGQTSKTYRNGAYQMKAEFAPMGETVRVSAQLLKEGAVIGTGVATTTPGEAAYVVLSNGQWANVAPGHTAYLVTPNTILPGRPTLAPS